MTAAIVAHKLSKRYRVPQSLAPSGESLRGVGRLASIARRWWHRAAAGPPVDDFWALEDVDFQIGRGEVVGIIGRNGAGKSTLLKILGRITRPTKGRAIIHGRVGTLLEVGTGFHPELTGRENIFLCGSILGMSRREIRSKLDEIVAFAEIEAFLSLPVKRYSSGMYVRLAFAVAAYLEPEILLIDEVLAVGDVSFQRKCLSRMGSLSRDERTVLFVSHNMGAIRQLCPRSILIERGRIAFDGATPEALRKYNDVLRAVTVDSETGLRDRLIRATGAVRFTQIGVENAAGERTWDFRVGDTIRIRFAYRVFAPVGDLRFYFALRSSTHAEILTTASEILSTTPLAAGTTGSYVLDILDNALRPGDYSLYLWLGSIVGAAHDNLDAGNASFPPLTIWSDETDPHKTQGFFSIKTRLLPDDGAGNGSRS